MPSEGTVETLTDATIPILTMEAGTYDEFQLGSNWNSKQLEYMRMMNNSHYITEGLPLGNFQVYSGESEASLSFITWVNASEEIEIIDLALRWLEETDKTLLALDKNKKAWDLSLAPERRAFWGGADGMTLTQDAWQLWNLTLHWILYDDVPGNTTIKVNVKDLDDKIVQYAKVNLTSSRNSSISWSQNSTQDGYVIFTDVPFGYYNIIVEFEDIMNDSLTFQEVAGERTYHINPEMEFFIKIPAYIDHSPPIIENIDFSDEMSGGTFYADVIDASTIIAVYLNLTAINVSNQAVEITPTNFTMKKLVESTYFNDTALDSLTHTHVQVIYNIIAVDLVGNVKVTSLQSIFLSDTNAPLIHEYNVLDYNNGTLEFYAEIIDELSFIMDPVILKINETFIDMHLNGSGYWIYRTQADYGIVLNYTIFLAADSVGNENGSKVNPLSPPYRLISPSDKIPPTIWDVIDSFNAHENGYVEIFSYIYDWNNEHQSGLNTSTVEIILSINGVNSTFNMIPIEEIRFYFEYRFAYDDIVYYCIRASDLAGNIEPGFRHGPYNIDDNAIPQISFEATEFGDGEVEFNATIFDWPNNETSAVLFYSQKYFGPWSNISMNNATSTYFLHKEQDFDYNLREVWYYITATDNSDNLYVPTPDQYKRIELTDQIAPTVSFLVENSTHNDGEISVTAWAKDAYGDFPDVNNTFYVNFTYQSVTEKFIMEYDSFYFHTFTKTFTYLEEVEIIVWTSDLAGNMGQCRRNMTINDFAPPKILQHGINEYQNGTVTFWAEIQEDPNGSGLPSQNTSITIEYIFIEIYTQIMSWNGSGDFFTYSVSGFEPENAFVYRISVYDNCENYNITNLIPVLILDRTPPVCDDFGYLEVIENSEKSTLNFWTEARDSFGSKLGVNFTIKIYNESNSIVHSIQMKFNGTAFVHTMSLEFNTTFDYSIYIFDTNENNTIVVGNTGLRTYWGPIIYTTDIEQIDNTLVIWANVTDWGSGIAEVYMEYEFRPQGGGTGGFLGVIRLEKTIMEFNGSLYITSLTFQETGSFTWIIFVTSDSGNFVTSLSNTQPYFYNFPVKPIDISNLVQIVVIISFITLILAFLIISAQKSRQRKYTFNKRKEMNIIQRFSDILSIRDIICRNKVGLAFYTEKFGSDDQDLDLTAGITSAVSNIVSTVSQRVSEKGEFDLLEREGFSILSHHNNYSTISIISEQKLSKFTRVKIIELHESLEGRFTKENLEDPFFENKSDEIRTMVYKYLMVGLLRPLMFDQERLSKMIRHFSKKEQSLLECISDIPSLVNDHIVFYIMTYTSSMREKNVSLADAYYLLEKCYFLKIIRNITREEFSLN
jgi:hypothetical protein